MLSSHGHQRVPFPRSTLKNLIQNYHSRFRAFTNVLAVSEPASTLRRRLTPMPSLLACIPARHDRAGWAEGAPSQGRPELETQPDMRRRGHIVQQILATTFARVTPRYSPQNRVPPN